MLTTPFGRLKQRRGGVWAEVGLLPRLPGLVSRALGRQGLCPTEQGSPLHLEVAYSER